MRGNVSVQRVRAAFEHWLDNANRPRKEVFRGAQMAFVTSQMVYSRQKARGARRKGKKCRLVLPRA
jgi:hypothetical protein